MFQLRLSLYLCLHSILISSVTSSSSTENKGQLRRDLTKEKRMKPSSTSDEDAMTHMMKDTIVTDEIKDKMNDSNMSEKHKIACAKRLRDRQEERDVKLVGKNYEAREDVTGYKVANEAGATAAICTDGFAAGYPCKNVDLLSMLDIDELEANNLPLNNNDVNDIWGWTDDSSGREFALIGLSSGTVFVEITDLYNPIVVGNLPTMGNKNDFGNIWRDIKTYENYAVVVSEIGGHGLQIFDLTQLLTAAPNTVFSNSAYFNGFGNAHNVFVNEDTELVYVVGSNQCNGGLYIIDMNNPLNPQYAGCFGGDGYVHDVQCVIYDGPDTEYVGNEICFCSNEDTITIVDVTDKNNMVELSRKGYSGASYTHQGWLTEDHTHFIFNDEGDENSASGKTKTHVMDVRSLTDQIYLGIHDGRTAAIDHNNYVKEDYVYQAHYRNGLNILQIINIDNANFFEAGYFDIYPSSDSNNFNGAWSNYPYFPSGAVVISGIEQGLFVVKFTPAPMVPTATPSSSPTLAPCDPDNSDSFELKLKTDDYGYEITWGIQQENNNGEFVLKYGPFGDLAGEPYGDDTLYEEELCLPQNKCWKFLIYDSYGDGLCCSYGIGGYAFFFNDDLIRQSEDFTTQLETKTFGNC